VRARLAVSSLAWSNLLDPAALDLLRSGGATGIELVPTKFWPGWEGAMPKAGRSLAACLASEGFSVPAFQAILFGVEDAALFGPDGPAGAGLDALVSHVGRVAALASAMGAGVLVFGSPRLRDPGALPPALARAAAIEAFRRIGEAAFSEGVVIGLEANPKEYGCRFCVTLRETIDLVAEIAHPGVRVHVDAGQLAMSEPDVGGVLAELFGPSGAGAVHVHASQPSLGRFEIPSDAHAFLASALSKAPDELVGGWLSVEMKEDPSDPLGAIGEALAAVGRVYRDVLT
jgi:sugar phosphate isomerase/epimerase